MVSNPVYLTTTTTCNAPTSLVSTAITATGATVSWAVYSATNTGYVLEYKLNNETTWTVTPAATATTRNITGLTASTAYSWRVKTNCSASSASSYATGNFTTIAAPVNCVDAFEANGTTATASLINVNQIVNAGIKISGDNDYYKVNLVAGTSYTITLNNMPAINKDYDLQLLDATGAQLKKSAEITGANEAISAYIPTTTGTYYIYVFGYQGSTSTYPNYNATTCYELKVANGSSTTIARDDEKTDLTFSLYPNPVEDVLNIAMINNGKTTYRIYSMIGQEVKSGRLNKTEISVSNLESGMYIFEVYDGEKTITKKFVKR